jgi:CRP/FNR family transcriptional regulator, anaerobic regulatory protein
MTETVYVSQIHPHAYLGEQLHSYCGLSTQEIPIASTQVPNIRAESITRRTYVPGTAAGAQRQGNLWTNLGELCALLHVPIPSGMEGQEPLFQHMRFKKGQRIYTIGQPFNLLYVVHSGFLKTVLIDEYGNDQVLNFPMKGDLFGVDGIHERRYASEAVALSECDVILLPFSQLTTLGRSHTGMASLMYSLISEELLREQTLIGMLGSLRAEVKVARFLVSLSERFAEMGYSGKQFNLRMSRHEIGAYLGLTLETVSRTLSALTECGLITVHQRSVGICDIDALRNLRRLPPLIAGGRRAAGKKAAYSRLRPPPEKSSASGS